MKTTTSYANMFFCKNCKKGLFAERTRRALLCSVCLAKQEVQDKKKEIRSCEECGSRGTRRELCLSINGLGKLLCTPCRTKLRVEWREREQLKILEEEANPTIWRRPGVPSDRYGKYGITKEDFHMLLIAQGYKCAICLEPFGDTLKTSSYRFRAVIDHNHVTDKIRGLLCSRC